MGMPVSELVQRMSTEELASWAAYESAVGPVGTERLEAVVARMSEQLHELTWWYTEKNFHRFDKEEGIEHLNPYGTSPFKDGRMPRPGQDWKFGHEDVMSRRLSLQDAVHANKDYPETDSEDGEAE